MSGNPRVCPVNTQFWPDIVRWLAVICSPGFNNCVERNLKQMLKPFKWTFTDKILYGVINLDLAVKVILFVLFFCIVILFQDPDHVPWLWFMFWSKPVHHHHNYFFELIPCEDLSTGPYIARGQREQLPPPGKLNLFPTSHWSQENRLIDRKNIPSMWIPNNFFGKSFEAKASTGFLMKIMILSVWVAYGLEFAV